MNIKNVWLAWWNNGLSYEDNYIALVGVFSTKKKAEIAGKKYHKENGNFPWYRHAYWEVEEVEIDGKIIPQTQFG